MKTKKTAVREHLDFWGNWMVWFHIFIFNCMDFSNHSGQDRSKTRYMAEDPDEFILYPVKKLIIAN